MPGRQAVTTGQKVPATVWNAGFDSAIMGYSSTTKPSSPAEGMHVFEEDSQRLRWYDGTVWRSYPMGIIAEEGLDQTGPSITTEIGVNGSELIFDVWADDWYRYECTGTVSSNQDLNVLPFHVEFNDGGGYDALFDGVGIAEDVTIVIADTFPRFHLTADIFATVDIANARFETFVARTIGTGSAQIASGSGRATVEHLGGWIET